MDETCTSASFWRAVDIYLFKPHVVNRQLFGARPVHAFGIRGQLTADKLVRECQQLEWNQFAEHFRKHATDVGLLVEDAMEVAGCQEALTATQYSGLLLVCRLVPKNGGPACHMLCVADLHNSAAYFCRLHGPEDCTFVPKHPFLMALTDGKFQIRSRSADPADEKLTFWLTNILHGRMLKWMRQEVQDPNRSTVRSLSLIDDFEQYTALYNQLKEKYGKQMVSIWPEATDPKKFVYEDVAIATYLLILWKQERAATGRSQLQSFVDIGCGNGLLVYILSSEGHPGCGIDLRKRKIWDHYPSHVQLHIRTIVPSNAFLFPDVDWLIGNHSDELSPWIPLMAARSSYRARFFLLPCCAYELNGSRFQRRDIRQSQYGDFLRYVALLSEECGFRIAIDRLKIPSTKRTCVVGSARTYPEHEQADNDERIRPLIGTQAPDGEPWAPSFKPRESVEPVRNCTQIDQSIVDEIETIVFHAVLGAGKQGTEEKHQRWHPGGKLPFATLVRLISPEQLSALKSECGGLQTLLKNNHYTFRVEQGCVQLRIPGEPVEARRKKKQKNTARVKRPFVKKKRCLFFLYHPDGCPLDESECRYKHE